ncbi:glycoside/pentoside/hexuronide:cation symporter, GPH family [Pedobacter steynii]|uniref:Glycoside/pentoside/hexuronide:cation symporter, GPH family n=1 Tax=Pedobacter steynii TaxID=430522 RepID=A0A1H0GGY0_9SPHI|nr:MFS transporter [Pedobacter steynii]NQX42419.1 MFS transporter [Pedobacter steynii]SDO06112.1 glycoside/pentoside/hexuronide:cation symporter, GPH family [Pedobacter steynii]
MPIKQLPLKKEIAYAAGMMGWSVMTNIIIVMLPYFYLPPNNSGLHPLVPQLLVFGAFNILSLIAASGRLFDAIYDPFIASLSDGSQHPKGRRIPIMKYAIIPAVIFCSLVFYPLVKGESVTNAWWLTFVLAGFFISVTTYIIPYNALLAELTHSPDQKVRLSTYQQVGFVFGMIIGALCNNYADMIQHFFQVTDRAQALQYTIWGLAIFSGLVMILPIISIDEKEFTEGKPTHIALLPAIKNTFRNSNFKYYLISDFTYYIALSIISSGLLFFVTVLLGLPDSDGGKFMGIMVILSLVFYPFINYGSKRFGKKPLVLVAFGVLSLIFVTIFFLGKLPFSSTMQMYILVICASFPLASLGILPNAILADIAQQDTLETGENHEGMFFAVKYLFVKLGQTMGIAIFAMLTVYGKDPGHDYGLRLNGVVGFVLCVLALLFFSRFKENKPTN